VGGKKKTKGKQRVEYQDSSETSSDGEASERAEAERRNKAKARRDAEKQKKAALAAAKKVLPVDSEQAVAGPSNLKGGAGTGAVAGPSNAQSGAQPDQSPMRLLDPEDPQADLERTLGLKAQ
jgi:hypothetical protein